MNPPIRNPETINLIAIRKSPEMHDQRSQEVSAVESYCKLRSCRSRCFGCRAYKRR